MTVKIVKDRSRIVYSLTFSKLIYDSNLAYMALALSFGPSPVDQLMS